MLEHAENTANKPNAKSMSRRQFIKRTLIFGGGALGIDQVPRWAEQLFFNTHASIGFVEGQRLYPPIEAGALVLSGIPGKSAKNMAEALTSLKLLGGPVMYAKYGNNSIDVPSLAQDLKKIHKETGMKTLSVYCQSLGLQVAAELLPLIGKKFDIDYIFMDCSPMDFTDVHFGKVAQQLSNDYAYAGGAIPTALNEWIVYGNPLECYISENAAPPGLYWDETKTLRDGKRHVKALVDFVNQYNTTHEKNIKMVFLRPKNQAKDSVVYDLKAESDLRKEFSTQIEDAPIGGNNEGHANPDKNSVGYNATISHIIVNNK
ncbi:MAG TPA: hypothetical protein VNW29_02270 [Candidatus Sulfotelmatobacter sp.]|jgi:hypothetical protein|nr:hypothetical protein [Candidatus Sulfotelmatobacter sp.]